MRFVVFSDSKGKKNGINEKVLNALMSETCKLNPLPQFIVMCGDTVAGHTKEEILLSQLNRLQSIIYKYHPNTPLIPVVGNHEVNIEPIDDRYEKILSMAYSNLSTQSPLEHYNNTVYYLDVGDTRLIILNAFHCGSTHRISNDQLNWFKEKASAFKKNKLVFIHSPAFPTGAHLGHCLDLYPENRDAFWKIIDECGIDIVFSGHEHNYSRRTIDNSFSPEKNYYKRSITQIISGGGGETLRDKYKSKNGIVIAPIAAYHFLAVDIETDYIKVCAINLKGNKLDEFKLEK
ncbi:MULTISPECIES: metallophosphoesterase [unclassified Clostridium]|uniref:metallophosphoesterase family protein n=1 Tax=unclassified Clostridium TaxID=2614128 RepID=UPI000297FD37|nr:MULTISPECIES: metallophosphoesterase [unclassified Clostridium]EKQ51666.1 MAG: Calcineurin-like phosphoesterase [Clostridium sp. Maddingley MBC34-26]